jgi:hypothetical protein
MAQSASLPEGGGERGDGDDAEGVHGEAWVPVRRHLVSGVRVVSIVSAVGVVSAVSIVSVVSAVSAGECGE